MAMTPQRRLRGRAPTAEYEILTAAEAMKRLALSRKSLQVAIGEGMPHELKGNRLQLPWPDILIWRENCIREAAEKETRAKQPASSAEESRKRMLDAQAELAEFEVAKARRELIPVAEAEAWFQTACTRVRARLLSLPPKLAAAGIGHKTAREAQASLQPIVYEVMEELHRGDDVALFDDEEGDDGHATAA